MRSQQQKMVVLGMLMIGMRYGWEMEKFTADTNMRQWTPIGMSTIYKVLKDLARAGLVTTTKERGEKGPARVAYQLTDEGRAAFKTAVAAALRSDASVYSDRIAGLVFLPALGKRAAKKPLDDCADWLERADEILAKRQNDHPGDPIADAIIGYYRDVYAAERKAVEKIKRIVENTPRKPNPTHSS